MPQITQHLNAILISGIAIRTIEILRSFKPPSQGPSEKFFKFHRKANSISQECPQQDLNQKDDLGS